MDNKIKISYPSSEKVYIPGNIHKDIKVAMRRVKLTPTVSIVNGEKKIKENSPVYVYDTSGPFSDPNAEIDLKAFRGCVKNGSPDAMTRSNFPV